jgi:hypothetical protein
MFNCLFQASKIIFNVKWNKKAVASVLKIVCLSAFTGCPATDEEISDLGSLPL